MSGATPSTNGHRTERVSESETYAPRIEKFTFGELRERFPKLNPPVIDGLLREGETANMIAASKVGKSWAVYAMALSVVMGSPWLGRFKTAKGRVLLVDNELHKSVLAERVPKVAAHLGIIDHEERLALQGEDFEPWDNRFEVWPLRGGLRSLAEVVRELQDVERGTYRLIIFDAKYRFALDGESENDNAAETRFYNLIDHLAAATGAAIVLIHHASKGSQSDKAVTDVGSGAGAQSRAADCHLVLREHEEPGHVVLDAAVRSFAPVAPLVLKWQFPLWVPVDGGDPSKLKGRQTRQEERQSDKDRQATIELAGVLNRLGKATRSQINQETGWNKDKINRLIAAMLKNGDLERGETENRGNKTDEFWLAQNA